MNTISFTITKPELKALYQNIGGEAELFIVLRDFYERMSKDVLIGFFFIGKNLDSIASKQRDFLKRAMGVTDSYSGKAPAQAHTELAPILKGHFDRRLRILEETLRDNGLTDADIELWIRFENAFRPAVESLGR